MSRRRWVPFGGHQLAEYLLGAAAVVGSAHAHGDLQAVRAGGGVALVVLAAFTDGPLALARWLSRGAHRLVDAVVAAGLVVAPLLAAGGQAAGQIVEAELVAVAFVVLVACTSYSRAPRRVAAATATAAPPASALVARPTALDRRARALGARAAVVRDRGPRVAGRLAGRAARAARAAQQRRPNR